jgi:hypothetical protein
MQNAAANSPKVRSRILDRHNHHHGDFDFLCLDLAETSVAGTIKEER